jgi:site-specific recombinase XerD
MLEAFVSRSEDCERLRSGPAGQYLDGFAEYLGRSSYRQLVGRLRIHTAWHFTSWAQSCGIPITALDEVALERFQHHLSSCQCVGPNGGKDSRDARAGSRLFLRFLVRCGVVSKHEDDTPRIPALVQAFRAWLVKHRGVTEVTLRMYGERIIVLLNALGEDPSCLQAQNLRDFVLSYARKYSIKTTKYMISAIRMFLRFLASEGMCAAGLEHAIPTVANWHLSTLPRYLPASDVEQVIDACDDSTELGARDRAIIMLLSRLGLRSGDILELRLGDIDWAKGRLVVCGKSTRQSELPLTQEVGDALLTYLRCRPAVDTDKVFIRVLAPIRPLKGASSVAAIVKRALERAGVEAPTQGAHLLRHSAATEMLRQGVSLQDIQAVLRHRSIETTTIYAKVDVRLLKQIAQPWPEVSSC